MLVLIVCLVHGVACLHVIHVAVELLLFLLFQLSRALLLIQCQQSIWDGMVWFGA